MKQTKLKLLLHWLVCTLLSFLCIYLFILLGGWRLFRGGDPILLEIAAPLAMGFLIWILYEINRLQESKIAQLEKRVEELEAKLSR